jgi:serine/threonine protein kinase
MQVTDVNDVKVYNLSAGKSLPEWISERRRRVLQNSDLGIRRRIELLQDFEMPTASTSVKISHDGQYIMASGTYKPRIRCFDVAQLSMKFERCVDADVQQFEILSDDYKKIILMQVNRVIQLHSQNGFYYETRIPAFGRDMAYHYPSCDLYMVGTSSDIYRLNLERGCFLGSFVTDSKSLNVCRLNPVHQLLAVGSDEGKIECWDPRCRSRVGQLVITMATDLFQSNELPVVPAVTALQFKEALTMAVGTESGQVLLYDIRSNQPYLTKDHHYSLPINSISFQDNLGVVISADTKIVKIWDRNSGTPLTSIEPETDINSVCAYLNSEMTTVEPPPSQASAESSDKPSAASSTRLSMRKETMREKLSSIAALWTETTNEMTPDTMHIENEQLRRMLREVTAENEKLISQVHHLTAKRTFDRDNKEELTDELLSENTQLAGEVDQLKQQCQKEKEEMSSQQVKLTLKVEELRGQLTDSLTTSERLIQEEQQLRSQVQQLKSQVEHLHGNADKQTEENEELRREREQQRKYIENLKGSLKHYSLQNEDLMKQLEQSSIGIVEVTKQVSEASCHHQLCEAIHVEENTQLIQEGKQSRYLRQTHLNDFLIECCLGQSTTSKRGHYGCNSIIYRVSKRNPSGSNYYALKALLNPHAVYEEMDDAAIENMFKDEYDMPCRPHPNVMRVLHYFCDSVPPQGLPEWPQFGGRRSLFLVMKEYDCNLQSHCRHLHERGSLDERFLLAILLQLFRAIEHLVKHNVVHRDLKLDNVLLRLDKLVTRAVVCDFGCSYEAFPSLAAVNATVLSACAGGNPAHHSPELSTLSRDPSVVCDVSKADVWAAGLMGYEIITGRNATDILLFSQKQTPYTCAILPRLGGSCSASCERLLQQLVSHSVEERPSASQAVQLCCIALYGPIIRSEGDLRVEDVQHWLEQQLVGLRSRSDEELLRNSLYVKYLAALSPQAVADLINTFLVV